MVSTASSGAGSGSWTETTLLTLPCSSLAVNPSVEATATIYSMVTVTVIPVGADSSTTHQSPGPSRNLY
jgi:hypothetical protein